MNPRERKLIHGLAIAEGAAFLGALILFLVIIGNTLVRIDTNLGSTRDSAAAVNGSSTSLPALVDSITASLSAIDGAVKPVQGRLDNINSGLAATQSGLGTAESNLSSIGERLTHTETDLALADQYGRRVATALISDNSELGTVITRLVALIASAGNIHTDGMNVGAQAVPINGHLASISNKATNVCRLSNPLGRC